MAKKESKSKTVVKKVEVTTDITQACNEFRIIGTTRIHALKKFKGKNYTKNQWESIFKDQRIL